MINKQTAVDYIVNVVNSCIAPDYIPNEIVKQAKQMEKEQIIDSFDEGFKYDIHNGGGQQYYKETYNNLNK